VAISLMITFLLIGFWHGASWNMLAMGYWHGAAMVFYTLGIPLLPRWFRNVRGGRYGAIALHTAVVLIPGGIFFRSATIGRALDHLGSLYLAPLTGSPEQFLTAAALFGITAAVAVPLWVAMVVEDKVLERAQTWWVYPSLQSGVWGLQMAAIFVFYRTTTTDFIYFQF